MVKPVRVVLETLVQSLSQVTKMEVTKTEIVSDHLGLKMVQHRTVSHKNAIDGRKMDCLEFAG